MALEKAAQAREAELRDLTDRESLAQGRLSHREDALQAANAESEQLRGEVERLRAELSAGRAELDEVVARIEDAAQTRWVRFGHWMGRFFRLVTFRGSHRRPDAHELARAAAAGALPAGTDDGQRRLSDSNVAEPLEEARRRHG